MAAVGAGGASGAERAARVEIGEVQKMLVDREAIFACLDANLLGAGGRKVDHGPRTPWPQPLSCQSQPQNPHPEQSSRFISVADVVPMRQVARPGGRDAPVELHEDRVVAPVVAFGFSVDPEL